MSRTILNLIIAAAVISPGCAAQFAGSGGMGGLGGVAGTGGLGGFGGGSGRDTGGKIRWRPWLSLSGYYSDNAPFLDSNGDLQTTADSRGAAGGWGISATKSFEDTGFSATYSGGAVIRSHGTGIQGASHVFSFQGAHRFNRNLSVGVQHLIGSSLSGYGVGSGFTGVGGVYGAGSSLPFATGGLPGFGNPSLNGLVDEEPLANRVNFSATSGALGYRLSMRSSVSISGAAHFVRRNNSALYDSNGYSGAAGYSYALDRSTSISAGYSWGTFVYPERFGNNITQSLGIGMSRQLGRNASISGSAGIAYFTSDYIGTVAVDPELSELLGATTTTFITGASRATFSGGVNANYRAELANFSAFAHRGLVPGNGINLAGVRDIAGFAIGRSIAGKLTGGLTGSISRTSGVLEQDVQIRYQAGVSLGYGLGLGLSLTASGGLRWQRLAQTGPYLPQKVATIGIGWTPGDMPFFF
jgi:hypothetical protein